MVEVDKAYEAKSISWLSSL